MAEPLPSSPSRYGGRQGANYASVRRPQRNTSGRLNSNPLRHRRKVRATRASSKAIAVLDCPALHYRAVASPFWMAICVPRQATGTVWRGIRFRQLASRARRSRSSSQSLASLLHRFAQSYYKTANSDLPTRLRFSLGFGDCGRTLRQRGWHGSAIAFDACLQQIVVSAEPDAGFMLHINGATEKVGRQVAGAPPLPRYHADRTQQEITRSLRVTVVRSAVIWEDQMQILRCARPWGRGEAFVPRHRAPSVPLSILQEDSVL